MKPKCPRCSLENTLSGSRAKVVRFGSFKRSSDSRYIQRFKCMGCEKYFSHATGKPEMWQKKRKLNFKFMQAYCFSMSQRNAAIFFNVNRKTIARRLTFLGLKKAAEFDRTNASLPLAKVIEIDELETFEKSKYLPVSVMTAVEYPSRRVLAVEVSQMCYRGRTTKKAEKKYGPRKDLRGIGRRKLFKKLQSLIAQDAVIKTDQNPYYVEDIKLFFPRATHVTFKGQKSSHVGQGELKKVSFDPIFHINHTFAMFRYGMSRLVRKTWCTTKLREKLRQHLAMYAYFHNSRLEPSFFSTG